MDQSAKGYLLIDGRLFNLDGYFFEKMGLPLGFWVISWLYWVVLRMRYWLVDFPFTLHYINCYLLSFVRCSLPEG
jgi:hypothetical protein